MNAEAVEARVRGSFARQGLMATLGVELLAVERGLVRVALPIRPEVSQQHGFAHGGAVATIGDSACGYAAMTLMPEGTGILTAEFKINLLAPGAGDRLVATGRVVRAGRTLSVTQAEIVAEPSGTLVAIVTATLVTVVNRPGIVD